MNRVLIFLASLVLTFVTISSASSASPAEWSRPSVGTTAVAACEDWATGGRAGPGWPAVTPSALISVEGISL